eukprot:COSAG06_NODE_12040_length_1431_cov_1.736486_3_plen_46_part_01
MSMCDNVTRVIHNTGDTGHQWKRDVNVYAVSMLMHYHRGPRARLAS